LTGWPWPFDITQVWFEGLWNWIPESIDSGVHWLLDQVTPAFEGLTNWVQDRANWVASSVSSGLVDLGVEVGQRVLEFRTSLQDWAGPQFQGLSDSLGSLPGTIWGGLESVGSDLQGALSGARDYLGEKIGAIPGAISDARTWIVDQVSSKVQAFTGEISQVFQGISKEFTDTLGGVAKTVSDSVGAIPGAVGEALKPLTDLLGPFSRTDFLSGLMGQVQGSRDQIYRLYDGLQVHGSVIPPSEAYQRGMAFLTQSDVLFFAQTSANILAEALSMGQIDVSIDRLTQSPAFESMISTNMAIREAMTEASLLTPLKYFINSAFTPALPNIQDATRMYWRGKLSLDDVRQVAEYLGYGSRYQVGFVDLATNIPGAQDLIRFVVREVISPGAFFENMVKQGYGPEWGEAFWDAHWVLPSFQSCVDAFHRGILSSGELNKFLVWHDYLPESRPGIGRSDVDILRALFKRPIARVDLRRGWELGALSDEDLVERFRWLGFEDDAPLMAEIQKRVALQAQINTMVTNAKADFVKGLILEADLSGRLRDLGVGEKLIAYHVADAREDRDRQNKLATLGLYEDSYLRDFPEWTLDELRTRAQEIIVDAEALELFISKAYLGKIRRVYEKA
jgi:hypothetical protein